LLLTSSDAMQRAQQNPMTRTFQARFLRLILTVVVVTTTRSLMAVEGRAYFPPPDAAGGWRTRKDAEEIRRVTGMNQQKLDEAFQFIQGSTKNGGLLVLRRGWLVYEDYFGLGHRDATPNLASCGKSFTSIAVGGGTATNTPLR